MFESTRPFTLFDYFRVPYDQLDGGAAGGVPGLASLAVHGESRTLSWLAAPTLAAGGRRSSSYVVSSMRLFDSMRLFGHIATPAEVRGWLKRFGGGWRSLHQLRDEQGTLVGAVWQRDDGSIFLPFDPNEVIANFWSERYLNYARPPLVNRLSSFARRSYYRARPLLPRSLQMSARRSFSRVQSRSSFPRWPVETALHDYYDFLFDLVVGLAERPVPFIGAWPCEWSWALVLTHDVERQAGYERLPDLLQVELDAGYRSSWNFVPQNRYVVQDDVVQELRDAGFEIGVHGLRHDGRDLSSLGTLRGRLPAMRSYADRWQAKGFRSPSTLRSAEIMPLLGFDYDSSYSDTAPFEPQAGGCCSWLPYMIGDLVELPITLPQDHTLFDLLRHRDETMWVDKARFLRDRGGMALILTHSDYVVNPHLLGSYRRYLEEFAEDSSAWKVLPRDVSGWWRRRSQSTLQDVDGTWRVIGAAQDDARVEFASTHLQRV